MTTSTEQTGHDTTSPAEMFLVAAERITVAVDFLARDWRRINDESIPMLVQRKVDTLFCFGQMREAEKAIALLLYGNARREAVDSVRRMLNESQLPIC